MACAVIVQMANQHAVINAYVGCVSVAYALRLMMKAKNFALGVLPTYDALMIKVRLLHRSGIAVVVMLNYLLGNHKVSK